MEEIDKYLPEKEHLRILDVGCGAGFFSILLTKRGHQVTGIDLTPDMILHARELAKEEQADCEFQVMDAENPEYDDDTFDFVISRNLTWTLPDAQKAYKEWMRVLKPGGVLLNFDANYGAVDFTDTSDLPKNHAHNQIENTLMQECEDIKRQLSISNYAVLPGIWKLSATAVCSSSRLIWESVSVSTWKKMRSIIRLHCLQSVEKKVTYDQYQTVKIFYHLCRCRLFQRGGICFIYNPVQRQ